METLKLVLFSNGRLTVPAPLRSLRTKYVYSTVQYSTVQYRWGDIRNFQGQTEQITAEELRHQREIWYPMRFLLHIASTFDIS